MVDGREERWRAGWRHVVQCGFCGDQIMSSRSKESTGCECGETFIRESPKTLRVWGDNYSFVRSISIKEEE